VSVEGDHDGSSPRELVGIKGGVFFASMYLGSEQLHNASADGVGGDGDNAACASGCPRAGAKPRRPAQS
jgi:hypothetical protein